MEPAPFADTSPPTIHGVRLYTPASEAGRSRTTRAGRRTPGRRLSAANLHGFVDVRAWIMDPQSFRGFFDQLPDLYADLNVYRVRVQSSVTVAIHNR
jgi:hypothetical protein